MFKPFLKILELYIPEFIKRNQIKKLFKIAADAFNTEQPLVIGLSFKECLESFAVFTNDETQRAISSGKDIHGIKTSLYNHAYDFGHDLQRKLNIKTLEESLKIVEILYKVIGIDFHASTHGEITISECYFSKFYSLSVCKIISSLDIGLIDGLSGGKKIEFSNRITDGYKCCKAYFS